MSSIKLPRYHVLDSFRGMAAIAVLIHHLSINDTITDFIFFHNSWIFVEFFFVLSGFVITLSYYNSSNKSITIFTKKRVCRILPLHIFMLVLYVGLELLKLVAYEKGISFTNIPFTGRWDVSEILPNILLIQSWSDKFNASSFNSVSWSISVEMYMYIIFFVLSSLMKDLRAVLFIFMTVFFGYQVLYGFDILTAQVSRGLYCFYLGSLAYLSIKKMDSVRLTFKKSTAYEILSLVSIIILLSFKYYTPDNHVIKFFFPLLCFFTVIVFSFESGVVSMFLKKDYFKVLGNYSYSIYMTHSFIIVLFSSFFILVDKFIGSEITQVGGSGRYFDLGNAFYNNFLLMIIVSICLIFSKVTYELIEKPCIYKK